MASSTDLITNALLLLKQQRRTEALDQLRQSLFGLHAVVFAKDTAPGTAGTSPCGFDEGLTQGQHAVCLQIANDSHTKSAQSSPHNAFQVFEYAFGMTDRAEDSSLSHLTHCEVASAIVLYNIGLSHHLTAVATGQSRDFQEALRYYSMSYESLVVSEAIAIGSSYHRLTADLKLFLLALFNNVGHIHSHFLRANETARSTELLQLLMQSLSSSVAHCAELFFFRVYGCVSGQPAALSLAPAA